jgi:hypothetical protein
MVNNLIRFGKNQRPCVLKNTDTHNHCTVYLIDTSNYEHLVDLTKVDTNQRISGLCLTDLISDQYMELWGTMKRGDLIYDVRTLIDTCTNDNDDNESVDSLKVNQMIQFPHIVDVDKDQPDHIRILRHGLVIRDPCTSWDPLGSVFPDMFTLTEFPIRYFDQPVYRTDMCKYYDIETEIGPSPPFSIWLDVVRLRLNVLNHENVFYLRAIEYPVQTVHYLYVILTFKKNDYMIITKIFHQESMTDMILIDLFIDYFEDPCLTKTSNNIDYKITEIAMNENIPIDNVLLIHIDNDLF